MRARLNQEAALVPVCCHVACQEGVATAQQEPDQVAHAAQSGGAGLGETTRTVEADATRGDASASSLEPDHTITRQVEGQLHGAANHQSCTLLPTLQALCVLRRLPHALP